MFSNEDNSGLLAFMAGIVIVVFSGIGLSIVIDRRLNFSNSVLSLEKSVKAGQHEIEELQTMHSELSRHLKMMETKGGNSKSELESVSRESGALYSRSVALDSTRKALRSELETIEKGFAGYREEYRETIWQAAINQSLGTLTTLGGRKYQEAFITRVTDTGLEIRHKDGLARIRAADLEQSLQERFQWSARDIEAVSDNDTLKPETTSLLNHSPKRDADPSVKRNESRKDPDDVETLRNNVILWKTKLTRLESERGAALSAASGPQKAPRGSLETWQMRAKRLESEIAVTHAKLASARASLEVVAPDDPLLWNASGRR